MYRVEIGRPNANGFYEWRVLVDVTPLSGRSRQPLLDACREIARMGGAMTSEYAALYRTERNEWDLRCRVDWGAARTVNENDRCFSKWREFDSGGQLEAAE